jgi:ATP-dependent DNA helicase
MAKSAASSAASDMNSSRNPTTAPSTPPTPTHDDSKNDGFNEDALFKAEEEARAANAAAEERRRQAILRRRKPKKAETKAEREAKARELDELLKKSAAFSDILTKKTQVLGRVGSSLDGKALGEHDLVMAKQPKCMINGEMRDYQLEGLTWMFEICSQGMSGILADEMGLGMFSCLIGVVT